MTGTCVFNLKKAFEQSISNNAKSIVIPTVRRPRSKTPEKVYRKTPLELIQLAQAQAKGQGQGQGQARSTTLPSLGLQDRRIIKTTSTKPTALKQRKPVTIYYKIAYTIWYILITLFQAWCFVCGIIMIIAIHQETMKKQAELMKQESSIPV